MQNSKKGLFQLNDEMKAEMDLSPVDYWGRHLTRTDEELSYMGKVYVEEGLSMAVSIPVRVIRSV